MNEINKRNNAIDMIKAFSMISVVIYHFYEYKATYIGVLFFFVISGYFITASLIEKQETYFKFLKKRLMRIYPTLLAVLVFSLLLFIYFNHYLNKNIISSSLSSLFGVSNIYQIMNKMSYFERTGDLFPLLHTWTLSIEIQFYIFYPFLIYFLKKLNKKNKENSLILIFLSLISAGIMFYKSYNNYGINSIYYGTDTRVFSLLIGGAVYFYSQTKKEFNKKILNKLAVFSLIAIVVSAFSVDYFMKINYYGLLYILSILGGIVILAIIKTDFLKHENYFTNFFSKLGKRSYSYYLWQYPLMIFSLEYFKWTSIDYDKTVLFQILILIGISELSYRFLENNRKTAKNSSMILVALYFALLIFVPYNNEVQAETLQEKAETETVLTEEKNIEKEVASEHIIINKEESKKIQKIKKNDKKEKEDEFLMDDMEVRLLGEIGNNDKINDITSKNTSLSNKVKKIETKVETKKETKKIIKIKTEKEKAKEKLAEKINKEKVNKEKIKQEPKKEIKKEKVISSNKVYTFVGDSVMKGSEKIIQQKFKNSYVDAKVSRQFTELPKILRNLKSNNHLNKIVVVHLGTNGVISRKSFDESMEILKGKKVYFINCVVPKRWEKPINKNIKEWSADYPNIEIIDWYSVAKGKRKLFSKDATHPSVAGRKVYTNLIFEKIK